MYAVAFDLVVANTEQLHPKGVAQAYADIGSILNRFGYQRVQGSLYVSENEDMANLLSPCRLYKPRRGFLSRCETFELFVLSSGQTSHLY